MANDEDVRDAALFRLWITLGSREPSRVALAIAHCLTADDYRRALIKLAREERINLP